MLYLHFFSFLQQFFKFEKNVCLRRNKNIVEKISLDIQNHEYCVSLYLSIGVLFKN
jgi:hypothetical protein